jgi:glutamate-5-semialdehyde dehydrogenase
MNKEKKSSAYINDLCERAANAKKDICTLDTKSKNRILLKYADVLRKNSASILAENEKDLKVALDTGVSKAFYDRLLLDEKRIDDMAHSVEEIAAFEDPVGRVENMRTRPSGIRVGQMRVPLGVVAVIYESRPNVTVDIASLCIKSGNVAVLRGGEESIYTNMILASMIRDILAGMNYNPDIVNLVENLDRDLVPILLKRDDAIDIVIPRGGEGLIRMVIEEATIPVIKHEKGLCHLYIDESAVKDMAEKIAVNGKVQRPGVCNAVETMLIHKDYPWKKEILTALMNHKVQIRGCEKTMEILPGIVAATEDDWDTEYLDLIISVRIVDSFEKALEHITAHSSGHSEAIVTSDYFLGQRFLKEIDSAAVFVNASTRFHDGGEFGLGAEVGISTQKLHARGTMGIEGLTTLKYIVYGNGEIR